jgi:nitrite reductase/ring-hydroxylating ferredoxin subunit
VADVPVGRGVIVAGPVLVVRLASTDAAARVVAYSATCPHAAITIGVPDADGIITCPGHGGHFRASDGARIDGPAPRGLTAIAVAVRDGYVVRA